MSVITENHFSNVVETLQQTPKAERQRALIKAIAKQMAQSGNPQIQQWGAELVQVEPQIVSALQQ